MSELVNNNTLWGELLVTALETYGIKYACLSPGSRNTPLILAFQKSKKIKTFVHVDERSSGFFALGLVYQTKSPVALVTTSGSAVTELYPAVVEAFYKHIPLLSLLLIDLNRCTMLVPTKLSIKLTFLRIMFVDTMKQVCRK